MNKIIIKCFLIAFSIAPFLFSQTTQIDNEIALDSTITKEIVSGLTYKRILNLHDSLSANVIEIDLNKNIFFIDARKAGNKMGDREKTSSMVKRFQEPGQTVLAAINADFFNIRTGENENNLVIDGKIAKGVSITDSPYDTYNNVHSQFAVTFNNKPLIEKFNFNGEIVYGTKTLKINRVNSFADSNSITLYNNYQGEATPSVPNNWRIEELELQPVGQNGDTVICIKGQKIYENGGNIIPLDNYILSINNSMIEKFNHWVVDKDTLKILLDFTHHIDSIRTLVGGWPRIIEDGINLFAIKDSVEGTFYKFSAVKHPRSGIGFSKDSTKIYLVTVDGRQESMSGMSLKEFADFMISQGSYQALNLDGGGSTTMVLNGEVVNSPSDSDGERKVGNCLVISINK